MKTQNQLFPSPPWRVVKFRIREDDGMIYETYGIVPVGFNKKKVNQKNGIALIGEGGEETAEFIVRACNAHQELLEASKLLLKLATLWGVHFFGTEGDDSMTLVNDCLEIERMKKAIINAEEVRAHDC